MTQNTHSHEKIKLKAVSPEDFNAISSLLHAALVPAISLRHDPANKKMSAMVMRYVWENEEGHEKVPEERVNAGMMVHHVEKVQHKNMDSHPQKKSIYQLHHIAHKPNGLELVFDGGQVMHIDVSQHAVYLYDIDEPWPAHQPETVPQRKG